MKPDDFERYWSQVDQELAQVELAPERTELPLRSTPEGKVYGLRLTSLGGYRIFAYFGIPEGAGPFPVIYRLPHYGSVVHIPPYEERCQYISVALCHRGQRLSDQPFAASYPGLLTHGIESQDGYIYRSIAADGLRVMDYLLTCKEVDSRRISVVGGDLSLWTAALRPQAAALFYSPSLFYRALERAQGTQHYPLEEYNDYLRSFPQIREQVVRTLAYFDPLHFAPQVQMPTMLMEESPGAGDELADALGGPVERYTSHHSSYRDGVSQANWLAGQLQMPAPLLPQHWQ
ncbi:MAG: acetylxylan esterase [bacterium]